CFIQRRGCPGFAALYPGERLACRSHHFLRKRSRRTTSPVESSLPAPEGEGGVADAIVTGAASFLGCGLGGFAGTGFGGKDLPAGAGFIMAAWACALLSPPVPLVASPSAVNSSPNGTEGSINTFTALNGMWRRSGMLLKASPTSK